MYEFKVVPAPTRAAKVRGLKTTGDRFSFMLMQMLNAEAKDGWEFLRCEDLSCEERGFWGRVKQSSQKVMIFRRSLIETAPAPYYPQTPAETASAIEPPLTLTPAQELRAEPSLRSGQGARLEAERDYPPLRADEP